MPSQPITLQPTTPPPSIDLKTHSHTNQNPTPTPPNHIIDHLTTEINPQPRLPMILKIGLEQLVQSVNWETDASLVLKKAKNWVKTGQTWEKLVKNRESETNLVLPSVYFLKPCAYLCRYHHHTNYEFERKGVSGLRRGESETRTRMRGKGRKMKRNERKREKSNIYIYIYI